MFTGCFLVRVIDLEINYFKSYGLCIDYDTARWPVSYPIYEYEVDEDGIIVKYVNSTSSLFYFGKGKKHRILINKKDHNKIASYREFVVYIIYLIIGVGNIAGYLR
jgi:hypothetical protein